MNSEAVPLRDFIDQLNQERQRIGISIRAAAQIAGVPAATVQGWLGGKHLPTPALRDNFLTLVEYLGLEGQFSGDYWVISKVGVEPSCGRSPYLGLRSFTSHESDLFFGRESALAQLQAAVAAAKPGVPVVLLGASGSGKSSLLAAGLLKTGHPEDWLAWPVDQLIAGNQPPAAKVLIIDQFEDVFFADSTQKSLETLAEIAANTVLVLAIRSDAFSNALEVPWLASAMAHPMLLSTLSQTEIRQAICLPAQQLGVSVDEDLVDLLISDLCPTDSTAIPAAVLPLASNVLLMTWQAGSGDRMTVNDYLAAGGLAKTVERQAERVVTELTPEQQELTESLFLRLIRVTPDTVVRERLSLDQVNDEFLPVMEAFVEARLLTLEAGAVRISHDVLLQRWPRLQEWIVKNRNDLFVVTQLKRATAIWLESNRDPAALIPVKRLPLFADLATEPKRQSWLNHDDLAYLEMSNQHFSDALAAERKTSQAIRNLGRVAFTSAAISLAFALITGTMYFNVNGIRLEAQSRQVALAANAVRGSDPYLEGQLSLISDDLSNTRQGRSALFAATSTDTPVRWAGAPSSVLAKDGEVVVRGDGRGLLTMWRGAQVGGFAGVSVLADPLAGSLFALAVTVIDGRTLVAVGGMNVQQLWDFTNEPKRLADLRTASLTVYSVQFSSASKRLVFGLQNGSIQTFDLRNPEQPTMLSHISSGDNNVLGLTVNLSGDRLFSSGESGLVQSWRWENGWVKDQPLPFSQPRVGQCLALSPDGNRLAAGLAGRSVMVWDLNSAAPPTEVSVFKSWINAVAFSSDSKNLMVGSSDQNAYVFGPDLAEIKRYPTPAVVTGIAEISGGIVTTGGDGALRVWPESSSVLRRPGVEGYALSHASDWLVDASNAAGFPLWRRVDGQLKRMPDPVLPAGLKSGCGVAVAPDGQFLYGGTSTGQVVVWPLSSAGAGTPTVVEVDPGVMVGWLTLSPAGDRLAVSSYYGTKVTVLEVSAGRLSNPMVLAVERPQVISFTASGQYLLVPIGDRALQIWSVAGAPKLVHTVTDLESVPLSVTAAHGLNWVAVGMDSGKVLVYDLSVLADPKLLWTLNGPNSSVPSLRFSSDDSMLIAPSFDENLWIWKMSDPTSAWVSLDLGMQRLNDVEMISAHEVAVAGQDGSVRLVLIDIGAAKTRLCSTLGSGLTEDEWTRQLPGVTKRRYCP